jgi:tetratricopeptide (TPR) repeat protein
MKPDFAEAHTNLALALSKHGQVDEAITHYRKALESKPDDIDAHAGLGSALESQNKLNEAIEHYQKALDLAVARNDKTLTDAIRNKISKLRK